jgi:hypothetical protein
MRSIWSARRMSGENRSTKAHAAARGPANPMGPQRRTRPPAHRVRPGPRPVRPAEPDPAEQARRHQTNIFKAAHSRYLPDAANLVRELAANPRPRNTCVPGETPSLRASGWAAMYHAEEHALAAAGPKRQHDHAPCGVRLSGEPRVALVVGDVAHGVPLVQNLCGLGLMLPTKIDMAAGP